ncbi:MAG TPA: sn-glycerol-1-phosphate dehydrogenase, partial [Planctomycetes bacterium]|nr:sn-glycerol-1-phosphate dehydrogenase [Planctomycetota bacterium]
MTSPREEREKRIRRALPPDGMTRLVKIEPGAAKEAGKIFKELFGHAPALVAADLNTFEAAGEKVLRSLAEAGCRREDPFIYQ